MTEFSDAAGFDPAPSDVSRITAPLAVVWPLLGRHIAFHRRLVDLTASVKAALLLSQSLYWTRHGRDIAENGGWFFKTSEQWERETGLSPKEQATAREVLRRQCLLEEQRMGIPARLHYRLCLDELGARLAEQLTLTQSGRDWTDRAMVAELLGPSLAYHRTLAGLAGGVHAGLLLSRALHLTRLQTRRRLDAWIGNSSARWFAELGLTRREQETARRDLARLGLWEETLKGIPPNLTARIRLDSLLTLLTQRAAVGRSAHETAGQTRGNRANRDAQKGETRLWQSHMLVSPKAPNQICRNRHHCFAESAIVLINRSTSDLLQPQDTRHALHDSVIASGGGDLVFPEQLLPEERAAAGHLLKDCGPQAQVLLDELAGRLRARGVRSSPIGYLRGLILRATTGTFVPELGPRLAAQRAKRQEEARQHKARAVLDERFVAEGRTAITPLEAEAHRDAIRQRIHEMKARLRGARPR